MCNKNGNRELVCTVGDLTPGQRYRTPDGHEFIVTDEPRMAGGVTVVELTTGQKDTEGGSVKLGRDRQDRLYASRFLNPSDEGEVNPMGSAPVDDAFPARGIEDAV